MKAPVLNRQFVLETPVQLPDGAGGYSTTWTPLGTVWGEAKPGSGREARGASVPLSRVPYKITVRAALTGSSARPKANQRLREGDRIFVILAVTEADRDGRYLTLNAQEEIAR